MSSYGTMQTKSLLADPPQSSEQIIVGISKVPPNSTDGNQIKSEETDYEQQAQTITKWSKIIIPFFGLLSIFTIVGFICGIVASSIRIYFIYEIGSIATIGGLVGAWGVYKWGTIEDEIDRLKGENNKYEGEIFQLRSTSKQLHDEVKDIENHVDAIKGDADELEKQMEGFKELQQSLQGHVKDNETIAEFVDAINGTVKNMNTVALETERSHLLEMYYDCCFRDGDEGMSEVEYKRFLQRLSQKQREQFLKLGTFKELAGDDNTLDVLEFQDVLKRFLETMEKEIGREFHRQASLHK